jgi:capsular polysaccharide biosynthesis protein
MEKAWRILRALPPVPSLVLWRRRLRRDDLVSRVLSSRAAVERHYGLASIEARPRAHLTALPGGRVLAQPVAVLGPDWSLLWTFSPQLQRRPATSQTFWRRPPPPRALAGRALFAAVDGFSYYHWLLGTLPKLLLAREAGPFDHYVLNPRHKGRENFQTESLRLFGVPPERAVWLDRGTHLHCDELVLPSEPCTHHQTQLTPWARELLREALLPLARAHAAPPGPERIYVTRSAARRRRLANEAEVSAALQARGYTPVVLESLPLLTQIKWLSEARSVVGLHGAGLANVVFCKPRTRLVEIVSSLWRNPCFRQLAAQCELDYSAVPGRGLIGGRVGFAADVEVDVGALLATV